MSPSLRHPASTRILGKWLRAEWFLAVSVATIFAFLMWGDALQDLLSRPIWLTAIFLWLFAVTLGSALSVVRHADHVAIRLGEPYGTMLLTGSVTAIEVMSISAVMLHGENNPTLVRDTLFAVIMIILNGMVGLALLLGGWRHREQIYNLQGANAYLGVIIPLAVLSLIMPNYTQTTPGPTLSSAQLVFLGTIAVGLYGAFLAIQASRHRGYFTLDGESATLHTADATRPPLLLHVMLLAAYLIPVVFLAEQLAKPIDFLLETLHVPAAIGGVVMAILVATPEAIGAVRAAMANHLQRSVNIFLGSVLSTIGLTIPAMIVVSLVSGRAITLGLQYSDPVMLILTLAVSIVTFASGRTNVLQGVVHLVLFAAYVMLLVEN
jgi:Ca2+:H+ antiporter